MSAGSPDGVAQTIIENEVAVVLHDQNIGGNSLSETIAGPNGFIEVIVDNHVAVFLDSEVIVLAGNAVEVG